MSVRVIHGDCREVLPTLDTESVQCVVTSPPYFGLRDYGTAAWEGGDKDCDHVKGPLVSLKSGLRNDGRKQVGPYEGEKAVATGMPFKNVCSHCGAVRVDSQIGLEPTPDAYVAELVDVFRLVRRVLRDDGVAWLNLGDSYAGAPMGRQGASGQRADRSFTAFVMRPGNPEKNGGVSNRDGLGAIAGAKAKDLLMIPSRVALALQADGWFLRSHVIWHKLNPMPESVTDRPTCAHESVFLLTKKARYYYDAEAVKERAYSESERGRPNGFGTSEKFGVNSSCGTSPDGSRNLRNVWSMASQRYSGAHFATFPPKLIEPCIKAGSRSGDTILDPFFGAGTTGLVADRLGRNCIGIELSEAHTALGKDRIFNDAPLFAEVSR